MKERLNQILNLGVLWIIMLCLRASAQPVGPPVLASPAVGPDGSFECIITNLAPGLPVEVEASTNLMDWTVISNNLVWSNAMSFSDPSLAGAGQRFYRCYQTNPSPVISVVTTAATTTPSVPTITVASPCNALRIWTGTQPASEPYFDIYVKVGTNSVQTVQVYRWQARILYTGTNPVALGTSNGRPLTVAPLYVPDTTEIPNGVTNLAFCDTAGPPLWQPVAPHVILPSNSSCFSIVATNEQTVFIAQFDGTQWSPVQFLILQSNATTTIRCNYRSIALANYGGTPVSVIAPLGSSIGGINHSMSLSWSVIGKQYNVTNTASFMTAISNAVSGDEIVLADGTYAIATNLTHYSFASNEIAGHAGAEGITFYGESGNPTNCVFVGATTNTGGWRFYLAPYQFSHAWMNPATFVNLSWNFTGGSSNYMRIWGGWWQFQNCRFFGAGPVDTDGEGNVYFFNDQKDGITNVVNFLNCQFDGSAGRQLSFSGEQTAGSTNAGTRIRIIDCTNMNTVTPVSGDLLMALYDVFPEVYGGSLVNAAANAINGGYGANVFCFFTQIIGGASSASMQLGSLFGCTWNSGRSAINTEALVQGITYHLFNSYTLTNSYTTEGLLICTPIIVGHNRFLSIDGGGSAFWSPSSGGDFIGNVCQGFYRAVRIDTYTDTNIFPISFLNNTIVSGNTGVYDVLTNYACLLTNNAFASNSTSVNFSAGADAIMKEGNNTLGPAITGYTTSASDIIANAALDTNWFPIASGNVDANGADLGWIGDSDPFGFVLVYTSGVWPRGARSRAVVASGAAIYPDVW
ncbi:MAG: hypothetical protein ABSH38_23120 [Verrucomicrobiota bacterium]|jgi:hypothetical protein